MKSKSTNFALAAAPLNAKSQGGKPSSFRPSYYLFVFAAVALMVAIGAAFVFDSSGRGSSESVLSSPPLNSSASATTPKNTKSAPHVQFDPALQPTEVHMWANQCALSDTLPLAKSWPRWPNTASAPFHMFAEL